MKQRIITGAVILAVLVVVEIFSWTPLFPLVLALCSVIAVYEMARCIGLKKEYILNVPLYILAAVYPFLMRYIGDKILLQKIHFIVIMCVPLYFFTVLTFSRGRYKLADIAVLFMTVFYILLGFNSIMILYCHRGDVGHFLHITVFLGAWVTDIFAYFCGVMFGKHKLIPDVSPKKTVEGSIGGILFCVLFMTLFGLVCDLISAKFATHLWVFAVGGLIASVVAQVGDLLMSVIKRTYGIKDYGKIFVGHGGMLDRFDSVLSVAIALAAFSSFFQFFEVV